MATLGGRNEARDIGRDGEDGFEWCWCSGVGGRGWYWWKKGCGSTSVGDACCTEVVSVVVAAAALRVGFTGGARRWSWAVSMHLQILIPA